MSAKDARKLSRQDLFEKRKEVVRLYRGNTPIMKIVQMTGLSWPSVNKAIKLYQQGGVNSLRPEPRGKKAGKGRILSAQQEIELQKILYNKRPWQVGIEHPNRKARQSLWTRDAVQELIRRQYGIPLSTKGVAKYLNRWGFPTTKKNQRPIKRCTLEIQRWLEDHYESLVQRSEMDNSVIYWVSRKLLTIDLGARTTWPRKLAMVSAIDNHRKEYWLIVTGEYTQEKQIKFLKALVSNTGKRVVVIRNNSEHYTDAVVANWIEENERIVVFPSLLPGEIRNKAADKRRAEQVREEIQKERNQF